MQKIYKTFRRSAAGIACGALILVWAGSAQSAHAGMIYSWSGTASGYSEAHNAGTYSCSYGISATSCIVQNSGSIPLTYNTFGPQGIQPYPAFGGTPTSAIVNVSSSADAAGLHAFASVEVDNNIYIPGFTGTFADKVTPGSGTGDAMAQQQDTLTPVAPAGWAPGEAFYVQYMFQADGEFSGTVTANAQTNSYAYADLGFQLIDLATGTVSNNGIDLPTGAENGVGDDFINTTWATNPIEFTSLDAVNYTFSLEAKAFASCSSNPTQGLCSVTSMAQMSNTASLVGIEFEDANGNPIPGFSLLSASGVDYNGLITSNVSSAPEPGTLWMLAAGIGLVSIRRWPKYRAWW